MHEGWKRVSDWCICSPRGDYTICKIGIGDGEYRYELWHRKNQVVVGMSSAEQAIREYNLRTTSSNSSKEAGPKSSPSPAGAQADLLLSIEAS